MSVRVYRVQDGEGRGPFRPGFSRRWFEERDSYPPAYLEWFGDLRPILRDGEYGGCGCRSIEQLRQWFRPTELDTLRLFGYAVVSMDVDRVIAENENEIVFARRKPLRFGVQVEPPALPAGPTTPSRRPLSPPLPAGGRPR